MERTISENRGAQSPSAGHQADVPSESSQHNQYTKQGKPRTTSDQPDAHLNEEYAAKIKRLRASGETLRSDKDQPSLSIKPDWFDETQFENAKIVYARHFMGINFAHLSGLLLLVRINSIYRTLSSTGKSDSVAQLFRRYYQTVVHVKKWYEGDIFEENSEAHRSLLIVRGMHNNVSSTLNDKRNDSSATPSAGEVNQASGQSGQVKTDANESTKLVPHDAGRDPPYQHMGVHISEYDIMITQFAFVGFIVTRAKQVGLIEEFSQHDLESMLHFWRVIGYYLGTSEEYNLCSPELDEVRHLCDAIMEVEFKKSILENPISSPPGIMGINIVRSVKFIPMLTIYGITKYLHELLGLDTSEFESRATRYSRLSYTLIKLVMTRLLAYRPFRWFNNGLTRLSVFLVGKIEDFFANHLDSKYGKELKV